VEVAAQKKKQKQQKKKKNIDGHHRHNTSTTKFSRRQSHNVNLCIMDYWPDLVGEP
jgi:hypothetical protein